MKPNNGKWFPRKRQTDTQRESKVGGRGGDGKGPHIVFFFFNYIISISFPPLSQCAFHPIPRHPKSARTHGYSLVAATDVVVFK